MSTSEAAGPDLIQVVASADEEVPASHADLHVSVRGSSLVTGTSALSKAREVATLVQALKGAGVAEADIRLEDVHAEVTSGLLTKNSSATYGLKIRCSRLDGLADVLGAITSQKNTVLQSIEWGFPDGDAQRTKLLALCATRATARARQIADALGVKLLGLHRFAEAGAEREQPLGAPGGGFEYAAAAPRRRAMTAEDLGLSVSHTKKVEVRAVAEFRVGPFEAT